MTQDAYFVFVFLVFMFIWRQSHYLGITGNYLKESSSHLGNRLILWNLFEVFYQVSQIHIVPVLLLGYVIQKLIC